LFVFIPGYPFLLQIGLDFFDCTIYHLHNAFDCFLTIGLLSLHLLPKNHCLFFGLGVQLLQLILDLRTALLDFHMGFGHFDLKPFLQFVYPLYSGLFGLFEVF